MNALAQTLRQKLFPNDSQRITHAVRSILKCGYFTFFLGEFGNTFRQLQ